MFRDQRHLHRSATDLASRHAHGVDAARAAPSRMLSMTSLRSNLVRPSPTRSSETPAGSRHLSMESP
jgi:hypothetical protein